jgi:hypothetical protein
MKEYNNMLKVIEKLLDMISIKKRSTRKQIRCTYKRRG